MKQNEKEIEEMINKNMEAIQPYIQNARQEIQPPGLFEDCCIYVSKLLNSMAIIFLLAFSATIGVGAGILLLSTIMNIPITH